MLLPALAKAREKARAITCTSTMKNLATISAIYCDDNNGMWVGSCPRGSWQAYGWADMLVEQNYIADEGKLVSCPVDPMTKADKKNGGKCWANCIATLADDVTNYRESGKAALSRSTGAAYRSINTQVLKNPSICFINVDSYYTADKKPFYSGYLSGGSGLYYKACHGGRISMNFIDGHAELMLPRQWYTIGVDADNIYRDDFVYKYVDQSNTEFTAN